MQPLKLLVFVGTEGIYHDHAGQGRFIADTVSKAGDIEADFSRDYEILANRLDAYDSVLFYTDVGELTDAQENGLLTYVKRGGGFFGLHTAAASFHNAKGYHEMLNSFLPGHSKYMDFTVNIIDVDHEITRGLADFVVTDELYYVRHDPSMSHHLMQAYDPTCDETHVMAFRHTYGDGRVFYFALGHDMAARENPNFQEIIRSGVLWVGKRL